MKQLVADLHTHTIASGHAYGTIRENVQGAVETGIQILGISEHAPGVPGTCDPFYFGNLSAIPREINGVRLMIGSEINVMNDGTLSLDQRWIDRLDYGIAGIHLTCYKDMGKEENSENLISCIKNKKIYFVSHPDDDRTGILYDKVVKAAAEYHVAMEVNNSSLRPNIYRKNVRENLTEMLKCCIKYQVPIVVSSDAHDPSKVGRFPYAIPFLEEQKFPDELILTNDIEKVNKFFEAK